MWLIENILGKEPSREAIQAEFDKRGLKLKDYEIIDVQYKGGREVFTVSGHLSTESPSPKEALMKYLIVGDELEKMHGGAGASCINWKDEKVRYDSDEIRSSTAKIGPFKLTIHRYVGCPPDVWFATCHGLFVQATMDSKDLAEAKGQAVKEVRLILEDALNALTGDDFNNEKLQ